MIARSHTAVVVLLSAVTLLPLLGACGDREGVMEGSAAASGELPPDHPSLGSPSAGAVLAPPPAGSGAGSAGLGWRVPESWIEEAPSSAMRRAQYRVPGPGGDGQCVVFYFGPGQGGEPMANAQRWAAQFTQPDGRASSEALQTEQIEVGGVPVLLVRVSGTYSGGMAMMGRPSEQLEGYALLGAIAAGADANWFFKFTGPEMTVEAQGAAFRAMIESLGPGA